MIEKEGRAVRLMMKMSGKIPGGKTVIYCFVKYFNDLLTLYLKMVM